MQWVAATRQEATASGISDKVAELTGQLGARLLAAHLMTSMRGDSRRGESGWPLCHRREVLAPSVTPRGPTEIWAGRLGSSSTDRGCAAGCAGRSRPHRNGELGATRAGALCSRAAMGDMGGDSGDAALCFGWEGSSAATAWLGSPSDPSSDSSPPSLPRCVMVSVRHDERLVSAWPEGLQ